MAGTFIPDKEVKSPGGKKLQPLPVVDLSLAMARMPSERVMAAATVLIDQLYEMENSFLASLRGRAYSRSVKVILEYYNLNNDEMQDLLRVLAHFKYASPLLNLATPDNDDGLKRYLIDHGVLWEQILYYYEFSVWTPVRFSASFILGLGYSAASLLEVLKDLFDFVVEAFNNKDEAKKKIAKFIDDIRKLSFEALSAMAKEEWESWNKEFSDALYDLDFDKAGFMLGKLGGDLYQILTGIRALAKLPGMTMKLARRFSPLFAKGVRATKQAAVLLGELLAKLGSALKEVVEVGFSGLMNFLDDPLPILKAFGEGALAAADKFGRTIFFVNEFDNAVALAGGVPSAFLLMEEGKEGLRLVARVRSAGKEVFAKIEKTLKSYARKARGKGSRRLTKKELAELKRMEKRFEQVVGEVRDAMIKALKDSKNAKEIAEYITRKEFGLWIHEFMAREFHKVAAEFKSFRSMTEKSIIAIAEEMGISAELQEKASVKIIDLLKSRDDLWDVLGIKSEKELPALIKKLGYADGSTASVSRMTCDAVMYDWFTGKLYSFDWTSGLSRYQFIKIFATAEKSEIPKLMNEFLKHAKREYVVRQAALSHVFEGWSTVASEILYSPMPDKLF